MYTYVALLVLVYASLCHCQVQYHTLASSVTKEYKFCAFDLELCNKLTYWLVKWHVNTIRESYGSFTTLHISVYTVNNYQDFTIVNCKISL